MQVPRTWITWATTGAVTFATAGSIAEERRAPLALITTDRAAYCAVTNGPGAATPLLVRLEPGSYVVTCTARIDGVLVRRTATLQTVAGQSARLRIAMLGEAAK